MDQNYIEKHTQPDGKTVQSCSNNNCYPTFNLTRRAAVVFCARVAVSVPRIARVCQNCWFAEQENNNRPITCMVATLTVGCGKSACMISKALPLIWKRQWAEWAATLSPCISLGLIQRTPILWHMADADTTHNGDGGRGLDNLIQ